MKITGLRVDIERWEFGALMLDSGYVELRIKVTMDDGLESHVTQVVRDDDLVSMFDYIWKKTGEAVKRYLEKQNENL